MDTDVIKPAATHTAPRATKWRVADTVALVALTAVSGVIRLVGLGFPSDIMFDETYYAKDACWYAEASSSVCGIEGEQTGVHPPLGKWLLAAGIRIFGYDSFGWRVGAAVAGMLTVALLFVLARRLLKSTLGASLTAGLLAFDLLHFVQSRIAMLDVFVPLFGLAAVLFTVLDRDRLVRDGPTRGSLLARPWRLAAGLAGGAATATKWSGVLYLLLVIALTVTWETAARREHSTTGAMGALRRTFAEEGVSLVAWLAVAPVLLYVLTYAGRLDGSLLALPWAEGSWWRALVQKQIDAANFHLGLEATHSYQSSPLTWIALKRPVSYYYDGDAPGGVREIFATGSPLVWWLSALALLYTAVSWVRWRDWRGPQGVILAGFVLNYLPWILLSRGRSAVFLFYLLPSVPFMCLALGFVATRLGRSWEARAAVALFAAGAVASFVFYYPLLAGTTVTRDEWQDRIWVFDNCEKPVGTPSTSTITSTVDGAVETTESVTTDNSSLPPTGWCWI
ncbi:MAG: phospholipid carrier-dependent glycosyltransferase [Actinomycetota bacterium]